MTSVDITPVIEVDALYHRYSDETEPQGCYIALDLEDGRMWASYHAESGNAEPEEVHHDRVLRFYLSDVLHGPTANELMAEIEPLAQIILDDSEIIWDGNNYVGRLGDEAQTAAYEIEQVCSREYGDEERVIAYDADEWYSHDSDEAVTERLGITADTTDEQIADLAEAEEEEANRQSNYGFVLLTGVEDYLTRIRDELRAERDELDDD